MVGDGWPDFGDGTVACCASCSTFRGVSLKDSFLLWDLDLLARCFEKLSLLLRPDENMMKVDV